MPRGVYDRAASKARRAGQTKQVLDDRSAEAHMLASAKFGAASATKTKPPTLYVKVELGEGDDITTIGMSLASVKEKLSEIGYIVEMTVTDLPTTAKLV